MKRLALALLVVLMAAPVAAQEIYMPAESGILELMRAPRTPGVGGMLQPTVVVNPTTIEFDPSPDHDRLALDNQPLVTRYDLEIYLQSSPATPVLTLALGKPTPVSGKITIVNPALFNVPLQNTPYVVRVTAVGPTGVGRSEPSGPFGQEGPPAAPGGVPSLRR